KGAQLWSCGKLFLAGRKKSSWSYRSLKYLFNTANTSIMFLYSTFWRYDNASKLKSASMH
ncbi:MAG: hypothetical protein QXO68_00960, partial [Conexivisphaerales archaeon]